MGIIDLLADAVLAFDVVLAVWVLSVAAMIGAALIMRVAQVS